MEKLPDLLIPMQSAFLGYYPTEDHEKLKEAISLGFYLANFRKVEQQPCLTKAEYIVQLCCAEFGIPEKEVHRKTRTFEIVAARHCAMHFIYKYCGFTLKRISEYFDLDHTTVMHGRQRIKEALFSNGDIAESVINLEAIIIENVIESKLKIA